jgi:hypothetical protein
VRGILFEQQVERGPRPLAILDDSPLPEDYNTGVFDAEAQGRLGGQESPHFVDGETDALAAFDIAACPSTGGGVDIDGVRCLIVNEEVAIEKGLLAFNSSQYPYWGTLEKVAYPVFVVDGPITPTDMM